MFKYLAFILTFFFFSFLSAEDSLLTLKQQIERLQREVNDLSKSVYSGSRDHQLSQDVIQEEESKFTAFDLRIYDLEKDIKNLNKNFEELIFQIDDIKNLYEKLIENIDSKLLNIQNNLADEKKDTLKNKTTISGDESVDEEKSDTLGTLVINPEDLSDSDELQKFENEILEEKKLKLSPEEEFQIAFDFLRNQKFEQAKKALKSFLENHKESKLAGSAHYWLGEVFLLKKEYREAALILAEGYQKYPDSNKAPDILYKLSDSLIGIQKKKESCNTLKKLVKEFPNHNLTEKANKKIIILECEIEFE